MSKISDTLLPKLRARILQRELQLPDLDNITSVDSELGRTALRIMADPEFTASMKVYVITQNLLSIFIGIVSQYRDFLAFNKEYTRQENIYMPQGPPMSPLTRSYFTYRFLADYRLDDEPVETLCSLFIKICNHFDLNIDRRILDAVRFAGDSSMGVYSVEKGRDTLMSLSDVVTGDTFECHCPSGYKGCVNDVLLVRVVPDVYDRNTPSTMVITPYVIINYPKNAWIDFFKRQGITKTDEDFLTRYHRLCKYGNAKLDWNEYIMDAYVNHSQSYIVLTGMPDIRGTKPHEMN